MFSAPHTPDSLQSAAREYFDTADSIHGIDSVLEARLLLQHAMSKGYAYLVMHNNIEVSDDVVQQYESFVQARLSGKPLAYIIGYQEFWSLNLLVAPCTLIPRQDTEVLVEAVLDLPIPITANVVDLGTGTGAIALALAKEKPSWQVLGLDRIPAAVDLARSNAQRNSVKATFVESNWFSALNAEQVSYDLIVTNPPYVESNSDYLQQGDLRFEPSSALSSGVDGLDDITYIVSQAPQYLNKDGWLVIEHGFEQYERVKALMHEQGFSNILLIKDYNNLPRVTMGQYAN